MDRKKSIGYDAEKIKSAAAGREIEILERVAGIPAAILDHPKREHPCPKCGGKTRCRLIDAETGAVHCSHCFSDKCGDFIAAVGWMRDADYNESLRLIGEYLDVTPQRKAENGKKPADRKPPAAVTSWKADATPNEQAIGDWCKNHKPGTALGGVLRCQGTTGFYNREPSLGLPMFGADLETVTGWACYHLDGTPIDGKKIINAAGSKSGTIGTIDVLRRLTKDCVVYKVEGPSDAIALADAIPESKRGTVAVFANACGANENPDKPPYRELVESIAEAGCEFIIIGDNDETGESGVAKWREYAAQKGCKTWTVALPETVFDVPVNDVRDFFLTGGRFAELDALARPFSETSAGRSSLEWEPFPCDTFPKLLQNYIVESAAALNIDPAYVGPFTLAAVASAVGSAFWIELRRGWKEPAIIWPVIVAASGSGKSPGLSAAIEPLRILQNESDRQYKKEAADHETEQAIYQADFAKWKHERHKNPQAQPPEKPVSPMVKTYLADDTTPEALVEIVEENPFGICLPKDELAGWIGSFDAYRGGKVSKDLAFWLSMHNGQPCRINRKTGKKLAVASTPNVNVCGGIQIGMLRKILTENEHYFDSGLAARLLFAMPPDRPQYWTEAVVADSTRFLYQGIIKTIIGMRTGDEFLRPDEKPLDPSVPCIVTLSDSAKRLFAEFCNTSADERARMNSEAQKAFWPKLTGYAARIALVFHVVKWMDGATADRQIVDAETMESAIRLTQWFKRESLRIVETVRGEAAQVDMEARAILDAIRRNGGEITVRELRQGVWMFRGTGGTERIEKKLREMTSTGQLSVSYQQGEHGRGKEIFRAIL